MALEHEMSVYRTHLPGLLPSEGKHVVIKGNEILGVYDTLDDALAAGYERFGDVDFLVKEVNRVEPIHYFSRDLTLSDPYRPGRNEKRAGSES